MTKINLEAGSLALNAFTDGCAVFIPIVTWEWYMLLSIARASSKSSKYGKRQRSYYGVINNLREI